MRIVLYILLGLVALFVILGLVGPKTYEVSRSIDIDASKETVFPYLKSLKENQRWSPWAARDTAMENSYEGTDGTVGSKHSWKGNKDVGSGEQTITKVVENEMVETDLHFIEPFESRSDAYITIKDQEDGSGSQVTWGFKGENGFVARAMGVFMDMDKMIGPDFEKGMQNLKELVESEAKNSSFRGFDIQKIQLPPRTYAGVRKTVKFEDMSPFFAENFGKIFGAAGEKVDGMPSALYFDWDEANGQSDMAAVVPVTAAVDGFETFNIEGGNALMIDYYGSYEGSAEAHMAMDDYLKAKNKEMRSPVVEEYITDPSTEPDTSKWLTKITYYLKD
ncbi:MAG: SRPBCC family protein [Saprospiraceae bacterium]